MTFDRNAVAALAGAAALLVSGGTALAGGGGSEDRSTRCEERLARIAELRGTTVAELEAQVQARLLAGIDAAEQAGRITSEQATRLRQRIAAASLCPGKRVFVRHRGLLAAAAEYLGLTKAEVRAQLPGTSLAALAQKQGKSVDELKSALLAPAEERLARAVASGRVSPRRATRALERLERLVDRLVAKTFPSG